MVWVILGREILVTILRQLAGKHGEPTGASLLGKAKTFSQLIAVTGIILLPRIAVPLLWGPLILSVVSGIDYLVRWRDVCAAPPRPPPPPASSCHLMRTC